MIAGEDFIRALAGLRHLDLLGDLFGQQVKADGVMADHRFVHRPDTRGQLRQRPIGRDEDLMMVGAEAVGDDVGIVKLVPLLLTDGLKADGEGLQPVLAGFRQQPDDQRAIQPAGQEHADGHVSDQAALHRGTHNLKHRLLPAVEILRIVAPGAVLDAPINPGGAAAIRLHPHQGGRRQLLHAGQNGMRRGHHGVEAEIMVKRHRVDIPVDLRVGQQRRQGGGKAQAAGDIGQVKRLDAQPVAPEQHVAGAHFKDREGEHAIQAVHEVLAPFGIGLHDDFGVGGGEEAVAALGQLLTQGGIIVDAAVEHHRDAQMRVDHGLMAGIG